MTSVPPTRNAQHGMALPLTVLALTAWQALPTLAAAWHNDLYARGAALAGVIWLAPQGWWWFKQRHCPAPPNLTWLAVALVLCATGTVTELRVCEHLALATAFAGAFGWRFVGFVTTATALAWLPASGWFLSHWTTAGLVGWERPVLASSLALFLLVRGRFTHPATQPTP
ncbi:MAG: hypothetical protein WCK77_19465 [Verrucomicrobiota bacterium]